MIDASQIEHIYGADVRGPDDDKIGTTGKIYLKDATGEASWATVRVGMFGSRESFVPLQDATWDGEFLRVPFDKDLVKAAPSKDPDGHLSVEEEHELYAYYGLTVGTEDPSAAEEALIPAGYEGAGEAVSGQPADEPTYDAPPVAAPTSVGDDAAPDDAMTRSEEHLEVATEEAEAGRARLRKYVVTEQQTVTVPVTHEEVRVEREPITDDNRDAAFAGEPIAAGEHEVVLREDRVVVSTEAQPVERVRLSKEAVTQEETITRDVRKEQIEVEGDGAPGQDSAADSTEPRDE
jgi:uncharacterized protein (TIGR02271 family)